MAVKKKLIEASLDAAPMVGSPAARRDARCYLVVVGG